MYHPKPQRQPIPGTIGGVIHTLRLQRGLTVVAFARRCGLPNSRITNSETNANTLLFTTLQKLAAGLGMLTSELVATIEQQCKSSTPKL